MNRIAFLFLVLVSLTPAQAQEFEHQVFGREGELRMIWIPKGWSPDVQGAEVRRQVGRMPAETIATLKFDEAFRREWLDKDFNAEHVERKLMSGFDEARRVGFAVVDANPPKFEPPARVQYSIYLVANGQTSTRPSAAFGFSIIPFWEKLDLPVKYFDTYWTDDGPEILFETKRSELHNIRYRLFAVDGDVRREIGGGRYKQHRHFEEWSYVCVRPVAPYAAEYQVVFEDEFGFTKVASAPFSASKKKRAPADYDNMLSCDQSVGDEPWRAELREAKPTVPTPPANARPLKNPPGTRPPGRESDEKTLLRDAVLHLDADRGVVRRRQFVTRWNDLSSRGNDAQTDPYTMAPVHRKVAEDSEHLVDLSRDSALRLNRPIDLERFTIFIVGNWQGDSGTLLGGRTNRTNSLVWGNNSFEIGAPNPNPAPGGNTFVIDALIPPAIGSVALPNSEPHVMAVRWDGKTMSASRNGAPAVNVPLRDTKLRLSFDTIGAQRNGAYANAAVRGIVIFPRVLTEPEMTAVTAHLRHVHAIYD